MTLAGFGFHKQAQNRVYLSSIVVVSSVIILRILIITIIKDPIMVPLANEVSGF